MVDLDDHGNIILVAGIRDLLMPLNLGIFPKTHMALAKPSVRSHCRCFHADQAAAVGSTVPVVFDVLFGHLAVCTGVIKLYGGGHGQPVL